MKSPMQQMRDRVVPLDSVAARGIYLKVKRCFRSPVEAFNIRKLEVKGIRLLQCINYLNNLAIFEEPQFASVSNLPSAFGVKRRYIDNCPFVAAANSSSLLDNLE